MPDFSALYQKPAGQAKRPPLLPDDDYKGIITGAHSDGEMGDNKTPFIQWPLRLTDFGPAVPDEWSVYNPKLNVMETIQKSDIDITKKAMLGRFFFTDDALPLLDDFLRSCGIEMDGTKTYAEVLPEVVGRRVIVTVGHYTNKTTLESRNQVDKIVADPGA
jgi:hypothetical protein